MDNSIGLRIKKIREDKRISQEYLAACLNVSQSNYGRLEKDDNRLTIPKLLKISIILEVKVEFLIGGEAEKSVHENINQMDNVHSPNILCDSEHIKSLKEEISFLRHLLKEEMRSI